MKLSLDALKERAEATASQELLGSIAGGLAEECHNGSCHAAPTGNPIADIGVSLYNLWQTLFN
ncbi:hypothetical protein [Flavobacterium sp.]|uniref:hypothetical protein n=1 Tax=Flavobacterium sp. TaxID=239 RepID=UPI000EEDA0E1|nr:hypothetical protein [Flavobacterium sp.]HCQ13267.1 hypothetical protein [Flavobacterium sp.]